VPASKAEEYLQLMGRVGLPDYRSTEGNCGAWCLHRRDGDLVHVEMFTLWDDEAAIRRFAGDDHGAGWARLPTGGSDAGSWGSERSPAGGKQTGFTA